MHAPYPALLEQLEVLRIGPADVPRLLLADRRLGQMGNAPESEVFQDPSSARKRNLLTDVFDGVRHRHADGLGGRVAAGVYCPRRHLVGVVRVRVRRMLEVLRRQGQHAARCINREVVGVRSLREPGCRPHRIAAQGRCRRGPVGILRRIGVRQSADGQRFFLRRIVGDLLCGGGVAIAEVILLRLVCRNRERDGRRAGVGRDLHRVGAGVRAHRSRHRGAGRRRCRSPSRPR